MFAEYMNTKHPNIKFMNMNILMFFTFLDVKTCRKNNKLTTSVYRKPTFG